MGSPNYVLITNEGVLVPKNENSSSGPLKIIVLIIVGIIIVGSIVFQDNLFSELSWTARILLICLFIGVCFKGGGSHRVASPIEIWFYEDYLIVYREKRYYDKKVSRKEYNKFFYKDISKCSYRKTSKRISFYGIIEGVWYDYNKDGTLPEKPTYNRTVDGGLCYFYTTHAPEIDFISEIESHSPVKVVVEEG